MLFKFLLVICFALVAWATHFVHQIQVEKLPSREAYFEDMYLPAPGFLQLFSVGHDSLMADILWLQTIQYYGESSKNKKETPYLYRFFDAITTLDPDFDNAYIFASWVMMDENKDPEERKKTIVLLEKGIALNPTNWTIPYQLGMVYYLNFKDYVQAAKYFELASTRPGAPEKTLRLAAQLYKKSNKLENCQTASRLWKEALTQTADKATKVRVERHFLETSILCHLLIIREKIEEYKAMKIKAAEEIKEKNKTLQIQKKKNRQIKLLPIPKIGNPPSFQAMLAEGIIPGLPEDPFGRPYVYNPQDGSVKVKPLPWPTLYDLQPEDIAEK